MPADKNYESVKSFVCDDRVTLYIHLRHPIDEEFRVCYHEAYYKRGLVYPSRRSSGAPTVAELIFDGDRVVTKPFPNEPGALAEAKTFLSELDDVLGCAERLYAALLAKRAQEREEELRQARVDAEKTISLTDFFTS